MHPFEGVFVAVWGVVEKLHYEKRDDEEEENMEAEAGAKSYAFFRP